MLVELSRIHRNGRADYATIPQKVMRALAWNSGDRLAMRVVGERLIVERVPIDNLAKVLRADEASGT